VGGVQKESRNRFIVDKIINRVYYLYQLLTNKVPKSRCNRRATNRMERIMPFTSTKFDAKLAVTLQDRSGEKSTFTVHVPEDVIIEDANDNGQPDNVLVAAFLTAVQAVTEYAPTRIAINQSLRQVLSGGVGLGQREQRYLCSFYDGTTGEPGDFELPCRDTAINPPVNTDLYDLTVAPWVAFKNAVEALVVSDKGNSVILSKVRLTGKNN
jgi:hypothetical protein